MKRLAPWLLLLPLALVVAWVVSGGRRVREDPSGVLHALKASAGPQLPEPPRERVTATTEPGRYDRETLYELIDGAADAYLERGFVSCVAGTFTLRGGAAGGPNVEIAAEVHRFRDAAGARTQRDAERPPEALAVTGVDPAVAAAPVTRAGWGADFLKLTALSSGPDAAEALVTLARAWGKEPG